MPLILPGNVASATASTTYDVDNSCRFNSGDSAFLGANQFGNIAFDSTQKFTLSVWVKKTSNGVNNSIFGAESDVGSDGKTTQFYFDTSDQLRFYDNFDNVSDVKTNRVFRDNSAFYNIILAVDTTQATDTNRIKLYVNGIQETSLATSTYADQNDDITALQQNRGIILGVNENTGGAKYGYFNGYMSEVCFIDNSSLDATSFGEFDEDSPTIWKPKDVSGLTFGTNGFYCDFEDSANLGNDANGGTDFTENNLAATDQATDTPTNNFPTINPLIKPAAAVPLTEGNLIGTFPGSWTALPATFGLTAGKWYFEAKCVTGNGGNFFIGVVTENQAWGDSSPYNETTGVFLYGPSGRKTVDNSSSEDFFGDVTSGDIIGVQLDLDSDPKTILFFLEGTATPDATPLDLPDTFDDVITFPYFIGNSSSATANWEVNFGNPPYANSSDAADENGYGAFEFAPDSGYLAICSKNLGSDGG